MKHKLKIKEPFEILFHIDEIQTSFENLVNELSEKNHGISPDFKWNPNNGFCIFSKSLLKAFYSGEDITCWLQDLLKAVVHKNYREDPGIFSLR